MGAFKHLLVKNEQRKFQSKENKSILEMQLQCMSLNFSSIPDVSLGVPRGPYSGCCPSWGWRLMVDVCPCAWVDVCPCAHDVCRSWGSLAQVRLLICHQIAPRARLVNLPSVHEHHATQVYTQIFTMSHTSWQCHTSVHTRYVQCHTHLYNATQVVALPHHIKRTTMHTCRTERPQTVGWAPSAPIFTQCALVRACLTKHTCLECICHTNVPISKVAWKYFKYLTVDSNKEKEANNHVQGN